MKKITCVCIVLICLFSSVIPTLAANTVDLGGIAPQYTAILFMSTKLSIDSWGKTTCFGSVTPQSNSYKSNLTVTLQKQTSNGWSSIKSWSISGDGYLGANFEGHHYVTRGTYRLRSTASIYNSSGALLETESIYSDKRVY